MPETSNPAQPMSAPTPTLLQQIVTLISRAVAIVVGMGAMPLLSQGNGGAGNLFWLVGLLVGLATIGIGVYLALPPQTADSQRARRAATAAALQQGQAVARQVGAHLGSLAGAVAKLLTRLRPLFQRFTAILQRLGQTISARLRRRPKATLPGPSSAQPAATGATLPLPSAPSVAAVTPATPSPTTPTPTMSAQSASGSSTSPQPVASQAATSRVPAPPPIHWSATLQALLTLLTPTVTIGVFVLLGALVALILQSYEIERAGALAVYFSLPGLLLWVIVEGMAGYNNLIIQPKRLAQLAAIGGSLLQLVGALFLWIYLGLAVTLERLGALFTLAAALVLAGVILSIIALVVQQQMRRQLAGRLATA